MPNYLWFFKTFARCHYVIPSLKRVFLRLFQNILWMIYETYTAKEKNICFSSFSTVTAEKIWPTFWHCSLPRLSFCYWKHHITSKSITSTYLNIEKFKYKLYSNHISDIYTSKINNNYRKISKISNLMQMWLHN